MNKPKRRIFSLLSLIVLSGLLAGTGIVTQSCSITQKQITYKTLKGVGIAVDDTMKIVAEAKVKGLITDAQWSEVKKRHAQYLPAFNTACDIAAYDKGVIAPPNVQLLANDLIALVTSFNIKL